MYVLDDVPDGPGKLFAVRFTELTEGVPFIKWTRARNADHAREIAEAEYPPSDAVRIDDIEEEQEF